MAEGEKKSEKPKFPKKILVSVGVILIILLVSVGTFLYFEYKKGQDLLKNPTMAAEEEVKTLTSKVGQLMELPTDEKPTIATVSDVAKLTGQPFFAKAKNGYKVLIYQKAKKAILYDPVSNKVIEVGPVNIEDKTPTVTPSEPVTVALYNGTTITGLTTTIEAQLKEEGTNVTVVEKTNAGKSTYTETTVVDLTGNNAALAAELAKTLGGTIGALPEGEEKPADAQILVILGK